MVHQKSAHRPSRRETKFSLVVGAKKMGKSTFLANWCKKYQRNIIVYKQTMNIDDDAFSFLPHKNVDNWRNGAKETDYVQCKMSGLDTKEYKKFITWINAGNFKNGLLIIDDCSAFEMYRTTKEMKMLASLNRHPAIDIVLVYHGLYFVPNDIWGYCDYAIFFATNDTFNGKKDSIPKFDKISQQVEQAKANRINEATKYTPTFVRIANR